MDDGFPSPKIEVGRILFRSWEHEWQTGNRDASSVASAKRLLPSDVTRPIYEILERWERDFLRSSLPYPPYGLRIRRGNDDWLLLVLSAYQNTFPDYTLETLRRSSKLGEICPNWDAALPEPRTKPGKFGNVLCAPSGDRPVDWGYEVEWRTAVFPTQELTPEKLLGPYSPRSKPQTSGHLSYPTFSASHILMSD